MSGAGGGGGGYAGCPLSEEDACLLCALHNLSWEQLRASSSCACTCTCCVVGGQLCNVVNMCVYDGFLADMGMLAGLIAAATWTIEWRS